MAVLNKYKDVIPSNAIYIGRGSKWGNPFVIGKDGDRKQVIEQYESYLKNLLDTGTITIDQLASLHGMDLVCFCAPLPCHGDVLEIRSRMAKLYTENLYKNQ